MLKCREVSRIIAADEIGGMGFLKRLEMRLHLMMCRHCHRYFAQIRALGRGARTLAVEAAAGDEDLARMERDICARVCGDDHS